MDSSASLPTFACPICRQPLVRLSDHRFHCPGDGVNLARADGIWRFSTSRREADVERFLAEYQRLRLDEGWGSNDDAYYRALPFHDTSGRHTEIWRIRAASYEQLRRVVLPEAGERLRIADLGAGNCWLSWRLAEAGHSVAAIDLSDDPVDGLGAATAYPTADFLRIQTTFDQVPFDDGELDLAIFNGSLHYSTQVHRTLAGARRLIRRGGRIVIMDSPVYRRAHSGERMLQERRQDWRERYGPDFGLFPTEGFLTRGRLRRLGAALGVSWRMHSLPLGWRWRLGPLIAAIALGRREPARFPLIVSRPLDESRRD